MSARGVPPTTVSRWYRDRSETGHPEKAGRIGQTDYWYEDEWTAWHRAYVQGKVDSLRASIADPRYAALSKAKSDQRRDK